MKIKNKSNQENIFNEINNSMVDNSDNFSDCSVYSLVNTSTFYLEKIKKIETIMNNEDRKILDTNKMKDAQKMINSITKINKNQNLNYLSSCGNYSKVDSKKNIKKQKSKKSSNKRSRKKNKKKGKVFEDDFDSENVNDNNNELST